MAIKRISMTINSELHHEAKVQCAKDGVSLSSVVAKSLEKYLADAKKRETQK